MNLVAILVLSAWIPGIIVLFLMLPPRRAAFTALVGAYLFLPQGGIPFSGMVDITRFSTTGIGLALAVLLVDPARLRDLRFTVFDLPMAVWCLVPIASSVSNGFEVYDGLSRSLANTLVYGVPYAVGRMYVRTLDDVKALAMAMILGAVVYVPLCLYEIRMSPQLHRLLYGFFQHSFEQTRRLGGWRPVVFLQHGLAVGLWMTAGAVMAFGFWRAKALPRLAGMAPGAVVTVLIITELLCKSTGAIALLVLGLAAVVATRSLRLRMPLLLLSLLTPAFLVARVAFDWRPDSVIETASTVDTERATSLSLRTESDEVLMTHALQRPWFGWGGWDRFRAGVGGTDSLWAIALGQNGLVGLASLFCSLALPQLVAVRRMRASGRTVLQCPEVVVLVVGLALYSLDCVMNAMVCPVFIAVAGALAGWRIPAPSRGAAVRVRAPGRALPS